MNIRVRNQSENIQFMRRLLKDSSNSLHKRKSKQRRSFRRLYGTVFVLAGALFLLYCSLFYVGAFIDLGKIVGYGQIERAQQAKTDVQTQVQVQAPSSQSVWDNWTVLFRLDRVYLRKDQSITVTFAVPDQTPMTFTVKQCAHRPILEIFDCDVIGVQESKIQTQAIGSLTFPVTEPGFYHFESHQGKNPRIKIENGNQYHILWVRG